MLSRLEARDVARRPHWGRERGGYAHESYARALAEFGDPVQLTGSRSWLLSRAIPNSPDRDGMGAYPFFVFDDMAMLGRDLQALQEMLVSVAVVPDPFSVSSPDDLVDVFDIVRPFKTHYVVELDKGLAHLPRHHRRYVKRALGNVEVEVAENSACHAAEWVDLYGHLIRRHQLTGISAFTPGSLAAQLAVPGCTYFRALHRGSVEAAFVCYLDRGVAYAHLISTTPKGQELLSQYALYWAAIERFRGRAEWFALGSVPGLAEDAADRGIGFFKSRWATATCRAYFCGRILDAVRYNAHCATHDAAEASFFPPYRATAAAWGVAESGRDRVR